MPDHTTLADVHIAPDRLRRDHTLRLYRNIVSNVHLDVLDMAVFFAKSRANDHIFLDDNIGAQVDRGHISSHDDLGVHDVFALHSNVLESLQNDILTDLVLLLREQVKLRLVVLGHGFHFR